MIIWNKDSSLGGRECFPKTLVEPEDLIMLGFSQFRLDCSKVSISGIIAHISVSVIHYKTYASAIINIDSLHQEKEFCNHNMALIVTTAKNRNVLEEIKV